MNDQNREDSHLPPLTPDGDPLIVSSGNEINHTINSSPNIIPRRTCLVYYPKKSVSNLLILVVFILFVIYLIYEIVLACYNCGFEKTNLTWIRASFFLNIPWILFIFIYILTIYNKPIQLHPITILVVHIIPILTLFLHFYFFFIAFTFEKSELHEIQIALNNQSTVRLLPCPRIYYQQVFVIKIIDYCFPVIATCIFLVYYYRETILKS
jgi:hypothetical protein